MNYAIGYPYFGQGQYPDRIYPVVKCARFVYIARIQAVTTAHTLHLSR